MQKDTTHLLQHVDTDDTDDTRFDTSVNNQVLSALPSSIYPPECLASTQKWIQISSGDIPKWCVIMTKWISFSGPWKQSDKDFVITQKHLFQHDASLTYDNFQTIFQKHLELNALALLHFFNSRGWSEEFLSFDHHIPVPHGYERSEIDVNADEDVYRGPQIVVVQRPIELPVDLLPEQVVVYPHLPGDGTYFNGIHLHSSSTSANRNFRKISKAVKKPLQSSSQKHTTDSSIFLPKNFQFKNWKK